MDGQKTPKRTLGAAALGVVAVAFCCGAPLLIVAGGAVVAALGWAVLGIGAAVAVFGSVGLLLLYRSRWGARRTCAVERVSPGSIRRKV